MSDFIDTLLPNKKRVKLTYEEERWAQQFLPEEHPWPKGVYQLYQDGKIIPEAGYYLVIPMRDFVPICPGTWVLYDMMANVVGFQDEFQASYRKMEFLDAPK